MGYGVYRRRPLHRRISTRRLLPDLVGAAGLRVTQALEETHLTVDSNLRVTQALEETHISVSTDLRVTMSVIEVMVSVIPEAEPEFDPTAVLAGLSNPVWWAELYLDDGQKNISSVDLLDALDYYGGLKENVGASISEHA